MFRQINYCCFDMSYTDFFLLNDVSLVSQSLLHEKLANECPLHCRIHIWSFKYVESDMYDILGIIKVIDGKELPQDEKYFDSDDGSGIIMESSLREIGSIPDKYPHYVKVGRRRDTII